VRHRGKHLSTKQVIPVGRSAENKGNQGSYAKKFSRKFDGEM